MSVDTESRIFLYILGVTNEPRSILLDESKRSDLAMLGSAGLTVKPRKRPGITVGS